MQGKPVLPGLPVFPDDAPERFRQESQQKDGPQHLAHQYPLFHPETAAAPQQDCGGQSHRPERRPVDQAPADEQG